MDELYAVRADPHEMNNKINDPKYATTLAEIKAELNRLLSETQ